MTMTRPVRARATLPRGLDLAEAIRNVRAELQPVADLSTGTCYAVESLARFSHVPDVPVNIVLDAAHRAGYGLALEAACLRAALARRDDLPGNIRLAVNVSPDVLDHPDVIGTWPRDLDGVIIEVTEHRASRPASLQEQLADLRRRGALVAVDDVGTGYAGLLRLATTRPDIVKIDRSVVSGARHNRNQGAVLEALVVFSHRLGATVTGEGVEDVDDLLTLVEFDVDFGQGWLFGHPAPDFVPITTEVVAACQQARGRVLQSPAPRDNHLGLATVTAAMARADGLAELHTAVAAANDRIQVDVISFSIVGADGTLREVTSSGEIIDTVEYRLTDYPLTEHVVRTGATAEVHVNDDRADAAERAVLERFGQASMLMLPVRVSDRIVGVLELGHRTHRRWNSHDIAIGQGLASHLGDALLRLGD